jgi:hypothetical protein
MINMIYKEGTTGKEVPHMTQIKTGQGRSKSTDGLITIIIYKNEIKETDNESKAWK